MKYISSVLWLAIGLIFFIHMLFRINKQMMLDVLDVKTRLFYYRPEIFFLISPTRMLVQSVLLSR